MRISCDRADPGFRPDAHRYFVKLDGAVLAACITADNGAGEAVCYVLGVDGQPARNPLDLTSPLRVTRRGHIQIIPPTGEGRS